MSSSGSKPKVKEIIIEHGEKFILGLIGLFVLIGIGTTQWSTYEKKPEEFAQKIDAGKAEFARSTWPETEKETFVAPDPGDQVANLFEGIPPNVTYEYLVKWTHRITEAREKVAEPEYLAIEDLVADAGRILIELSPEQKEAVEGTVPGVRVASADEVTRQNTVARPKPDGPRVERPRRNGQPGTSPSPSDSTTANPYAGGPSEYGGDPSMAGYPNDGMSGYGGAARNVEARGTRFAAVRGIFRMKQQIEKVQRALRLDKSQEAYMQVRFWDFELQRQTAVAGSNPWPNEWEDVDIDVAVKLLKRIEFDVDVVDELYRDAVFTMPLPYRVTGSWATAAGPNGILASHPQIKRLLTEKEQLEQETRAKALLKAAEQEEKIKESTGRGFQQVQVNTRSMRGSMMGNSSAMSAYSESYDALAKEADPEYGSSSSSSGYPGGRSMGRMDVVATPELMLFRFLDFSVVPGNAYRYRVRLKLLNPNFDRDPGELQDFASREGKYRFTPWSEVSTPALIEDENEVYVAKVDDRRGVSMDAYQWMTETGMYVHGQFEGLDRGDRIARWTKEVTSRKRGSETEIKGGITTEVLRPSAGTFMEEQIDFVTPNTLVDFNRETLLNPEDHPDLELATKKLPNVLQEVVVVNRFGDLVRLDTVGNESAYERAKSRMSLQDELWAHLKRAAVGSGESTPTTNAKRRRSSLKRNSSMMQIPPQPQTAVPPKQGPPVSQLAAPASQPEVVTNSIGMKLKLIPSGEFQMGSPIGEKDHGNDEQQHQVRITQSFYLQTTEVTQGQWVSVTGTPPAEWPNTKVFVNARVKEGLDYPATYVSWTEAVGFCEKLSLREGIEYRLPSEAEWEYACRAGSSTAYSFGDDAALLSRYAWWGGTAPNNGNARYEMYPHRVGLLRPNNWGLYDMHGNASEWCDDKYAPYDDKTSLVVNPRGPSSGYQVSRGGSWSRPAGHCRSAIRERQRGIASGSIGFRVLRCSVK
ncbi:MAG: formylglycine-generating enzyme family protein [Rhodopirellula sp.]|nr:formylglycine-generating enzyme family protein [Rhodopirellula sp.]